MAIFRKKKYTGLPISATKAWAGYIVKQELLLQILIPIFSGVLALVGAYWGSRWARRLEYQKWALQNRSAAYVQFLSLLASAELSASNILLDRFVEELDQDIKITEAYLPALNYVRVVRLYLPKDLRKKFSDLAHEYYVLHSSRDIGDSRRNKMARNLDEIQEIFEATL